MSTVSLFPPSLVGLLVTKNSYYTVLRLSLPRVSIKDISYEGLTLPKGTVFFLNAWACNMGRLHHQSKNGTTANLAS